MRTHAGKTLNPYQGLKLMSSVPDNHEPYEPEKP